MPWPVHPTGFFGTQGDQDTYRIERSLRFNSADSAYLSRTFGTPTNQNVWTLSVWIKGASLTSASIMGVVTTGYELIYFDSTNALKAETWINTPPIQSRNQKTNAIFRDTSAWYHFVISKNGSWTSGYPYTIYLNGISQSLTTFNLNTNFVDRINTNGVSHQIGADGSGANLFNGYMAEYYFIDGQALTPSSFGETDAITGRWKAKAYSGTYGTNGFYLKFADNSGTTATTLGKDSSGNGNNWTPNNFSVTAGVGNDSLVDSPTNYGTDSGVGGEVRGNYATLNPNDLNAPNNNASVTLSNGNLDGTLTNGANRALSTIGVLSGKWYAEIAITSITGGVGQAGVLVGYIGGAGNGAGGGAGMVQYQASGNKRIDTGSASSYGASYTTNDIIGIALDMDSSQVTFYKNNSSQGAISLASTGQPYGIGFNWNTVTGQTVAITANFGQRPFAYTAPTGFKALCTTNLPTPTIRKPSSAMDVVTYTGNGSARSITGLGFSPDLVWIKGRSGATDHAIYDSVRGVQLDLVSNSTAAETTQSQGVTAFNSDGFSIGTLAKLNTNTSTYVAWAWDEAPIAGMDIVSYTGTGVARTIPHNLGVVPSMIITKTTNTNLGNWGVYHRSLGATQAINLNTTNAAFSGSAWWNNTAPTSSVFSVGTSNDVNGASNYIAYLFAEVEGFSKFGSYTGNGSADGPFVWCGFRPRWVMVKRTDANGYSWVVSDSSRNSQNGTSYELYPDLSNAEGGPYSPPVLDYISNGFKIRSSTASASNTNGGTYIFAAFAESPFKYARAR